MKQKSQSAVFASVLIIVIALALIIYIMVIPPAEREALIKGDANSVGQHDGGGSDSGAPSYTQAELDEFDFQFTGPGDRKSVV